ncbi:MAG: hypothetical protein HC898_12940 [Phycisphaerales bacterium]|nr:hypothetical protein [Phycisphaerales bacterium]
MGYRDMELDEIQALVGERHAVTGMEYPPQGLQPYYQWLISSLHQLAQASAGAFRVDRDADLLTSVYVAPGRARWMGWCWCMKEGALRWRFTTTHRLISGWRMRAVRPRSGW